MEYRRLGRSGARVSTIGLGGNQFGRTVDGAGTARVIATALELGVNFIDTADSYAEGRSEELLGEAVRGHRDDFVIASKTGSLAEPIGRLSRRQIMRRVDQSLRRLATDFIDLYYLHFPDPGTDLDESLRALDDLVRAGKIRYTAISNHAGWQLAEAAAICDRQGFAPPVVTQNQYNLVDRAVEKELLPAARHFGLALVPYSPLAGGFLTGKYRRGEPAPAGVRGHDNERFRRLWLRNENFDILDRCEAYAGERGRPVGELAIAWLLIKPEVCSVIAGVTSADQLRANVQAGDWKLEGADLDLLDSHRPPD